METVHPWRNRRAVRRREAVTDFDSIEIIGNANALVEFPPVDGIPFVPGVSLEFSPIYSSSLFPERFFMETEDDG